MEMCIDEEQYNDLKTGQEGVARTLVRMDERMGNMETTLDRVDEAVYGNGTVGLRTEVEVMKATMGLKDEHITAQVTNVRERSVDWKWVVNILISGGTLVALIRHLAHIP